tara:strand:+ start:175 stop:516 length:342 start_codon:yes stop_codon:yes gene_type:complete
MLTLKELKTLIKGHNKLSVIKIPAKSTISTLTKLIEEKGFVVDHDKKVIKPGVKRGKQLKLLNAEELIKPKVKSEEQKEKTITNKRKSIIKYILDNKDILNEPDIKLLHKGLK